ncbi:undecaprenyl-phosphate glucose phosphotransferase [Methylolobus aquaticus]
MKIVQSRPRTLDVEEESPSTYAYRVSALGSMRSMTNVDFPLVTLVKLLLFPAMIVATLALAVRLQGEVFTSYYVILALLSFLISAHVFEEISLYRALQRFPVFVALSNILLRWVIIVAIIVFLGYATELHGHFSEAVLIRWFVITPVVLLSAQVAARSAIYHVLTATQQTRNAVIVGANQLGYELCRKINDDRLLHTHVKGFFDDRRIQRLPLVSDAQKLGELKDLPDYVKENGINLIYVCLPMASQPRIIRLLDELRDTTASIYFVPDIFMFDLIQARIDRITGIPVVAICETPFYGFRGLVKRVSDILLGIFILLLIWPVMLAVGLGVKLTSPGPIIFKQRRYGLDGDEIVVYKFRTMRVCEDGDTVVQARRDDDRITPLGRILRKTSLDELPQFLNVLEGKMSIVGPRPHAVAHNEMYRKVIKGYMIRHKVKPGITGWAQVNGFRGETESVDKMKARVEYDLDYLRNWSLALDLWIIFKTVLLVFRDKDAF